MLKFRITNEEFEELPEIVQGEYEQDGDDYVLSIDGAVPKNKLDEFRTSNRKLNKKLKDMEEKYDGIDLDKVKELMTREEQIKEGELIEAGKLDEVVENRVKKALEPVIAERDGFKQQLGETKETLNRLLIDKDVVKVAAKLGAHDTAIDDITFRARNAFKVVEGKAIAVDEDGDPRLDANGNPVSMEAWLGELKTKQAPHLFRGAKGGNEGGNEGGKKPMGEKTSHEKIKAGLQKA